MRLDDGSRSDRLSLSQNNGFNVNDWMITKADNSALIAARDWAKTLQICFLLAFHEPTATFLSHFNHLLSWFMSNSLSIWATTLLKANNTTTITNATGFSSSPPQLERKYTARGTTRKTLLLCGYITMKQLAEAFYLLFVTIRCDWRKKDARETCRFPCRTRLLMTKKTKQTKRRWQRREEKQLQLMVIHEWNLSNLSSPRNVQF